MAAMTLLLSATSKADAPKFSADQCRVLRQSGVDVTGLDCPPPPKPRKKR